MIVPSIDLMDGQAVQLIGGKQKVLEAGDPRPLARRFGRVGEVAVVDLDAALGRGSNTELIRELLRLAPCRVGGGIRTVAAAREWLDAGAVKVVMGTAATPEILRELPPDRVVAALDAVHGEVVVEGWQTRTGHGVVERMQALRGLVSGFLVTFVEREGRMGGVDLQQICDLVRAAGPARLTVAGGVTTVDDVAAIDAAGADAQVGMALYTGHMDLAEAFAAPLRRDANFVMPVNGEPTQLWPTVVVDAAGGALGLAWSSEQSLREAIASGRGAYCSRRRGLWIKGDTSGDRQDLLAVALDCDRDALRFVVRQHGEGFCHNGTWTCWGPDRGMPALLRLLHERQASAPEGSYTRRLLEDPNLLRSKLLEEAGELAAAANAAEVTHEAADVLYFALVAMARAGVTLEDVAAELDRRALKVTRRPGDAKK